MGICRTTALILITSQLILQICAYKPVPDLVRVRRREDAGDAEFVALDFIGLVEEQGRTAVQHNVTTKDGYKLQFFRVPPNSNSSEGLRQNRAVFLGHGLLSSSDCYVLFGIGRSIVYMLSDAGYDVWVGNVRGNTYCREHETLSPDQAEFWNFSIDEYSNIDLPTMLDYILNYTGQKKISYIGHSMGSTLSLMLLADKPEYTEKIDIVIHMAPSGYREPTFRRAIQGISRTAIQKIFDPQGTTEVGRQSSNIAAFFTRICVPNNLVELCYWPTTLGNGDDPEQLSRKDIVDSLVYFPAGTSSKCLYHYNQMFLTSTFRRYDYGRSSLNRKHYGQPEPPVYDLSHVYVPMVMFVGQGDPLGNLADTKLLISHFPPDAPIHLEIVPHKSFSHLSYIAAKDVKKLVYDRILELLTAFHDKNQFPGRNV